jgi:hypothetical protein
VSLAILLVLNSCNQAQQRCPSLERLLSENPKEEALKALKTGDRRLLALGGYSPSVPGDYDGTRPIHILPDTGDVRTRACSALMDRVEVYVVNYNRTLREQH